MNYLHRALMAPVLVLLAIAAQATAAEDPPSELPIATTGESETDHERRVRELSERVALLTLQSQVRALENPVPTVQRKAGNITVNPEESKVVSEWAILAAVSEISGPIGNALVRSGCDSILLTSRQRASQGIARAELVNAIGALKHNDIAELRNFEKEDATLASHNLVSAESIIASLATLASYFKEDIELAQKESEVVGEALLESLAFSSLASDRPPMFVPMASAAHTARASKVVAFLRYQASKAESIQAALASTEKSLELASQLSIDIAIQERLSSDTACILETSTNLQSAMNLIRSGVFRSARMYDRGTVSINWMLLRRSGEIVRAGTATAICEADLRLTRSPEGIEPRCRTV